jgi:FMN phosphatase YigB (HAD superfamily)
MNKALDDHPLDLGGVLIDVDYHASAQGLPRNLGFSDFDSLYSKRSRTTCSMASRPGILALTSSVIGYEFFRGQLTDPRSMRAGTPCSVPFPRNDPLVERLKERYQVLLLSNTNAIHVPAFKEIIARENGITDFKDLFHGAYYSCEIGYANRMLRPSMHVLERHERRPARTLFIDDSIQHVHGARAAGLHAEHLDLEKEDVIHLWIG